MNVGIFMMPLHPPEKDRTQCFDEDTECIILADEQGYSEAWIGQHHSAAWEPIPSNDVFIAHMISQTRNIRLGTGVSIVTQHHPVNIAIRLAYLDHLSRGRLNVGFGQGGIKTDWTLFDLPDPKEQGLMTLEAIDMVLKLWSAEVPFDFKGNYWHIAIEEKIPHLGMGHLLKPFQKPHPPLAMSIVKPESMAARTAGRRGVIPISISMTPHHKAKRQWEIYCEGAAEGGQPAPDRANWRISRSIYVGESNDEAREHCLEGAFARSLIYLRDIAIDSGIGDLSKKDEDMPDAAVDAEYLVDEIAVVGDADTVTEKLQALYDDTGGFGTVLQIAHDWDDKAKMRKSMERLAKEVIPRLP
jgi:alkanesulfonate monooxygenase SsuD/methylene tetrahydromethanopterin reductase-like flavin-dependent oxidoreductase (luciferase family)